jgi:hypothetical protein
VWSLIKHRVRLHGVVLGEAQGQLNLHYSIVKALLGECLKKNYEEIFIYMIDE